MFTEHGLLPAPRNPSSFLPYKIGGRPRILLNMFTIIVISLLSVSLGALLAWTFLRRLGRSATPTTTTHIIAERIRAVGKLVGLEVMSKEIVTQTRGLSWLPPLLLSQARLAMIFSFEKQYFVDLALLREDHVEHLGARRYRLTLPPIDGSLRLLDVTPYDIQSGKLLGLLDVFRMDAPAQKELMVRAQDEAQSLYETHAARYEDEARRAVVRQVVGLLQLFDIEIEVRFEPAGGLPRQDRRPTGPLAVAVG